MRFSTRRLAAIVSTTSMLLALAACGGSDEPAVGGSLESKAKDEGAVTWYTTIDPVVAEELAADFKKRHGVTVSVVRGPTAEIMQRYESEKDSGAVVADVLSVTDLGVFEGGQGADEFMTLDPEVVTSLKTLPAESFRYETTVDLGMGVAVIAYNTDKLSASEVPKSWNDLIAKDYGNVAIPEWSASPANLLALYMWDELLGEDYLSKFGDLPTTTYASGVAAVQALAAGEHSVLAPAFVAFVKPLMDTGAPIDFVVPDDNVVIPMHSAAVSDAPHPNAALLFTNYLISVEGQTIFNRDVSASPLEAVKGDIDLPDEYIAIRTEDLLARKDELVNKVSGK